LIKQSKQIEELLEQYEWSTEERQWLLNYLENSKASELEELMQGHYSDDLLNATSIDPIISERLLSNIHQKIIINRKQEKAKRVRMWTLRMAAACVVGFLALSTFLWLKNNSKQPIPKCRSISKSTKMIYSLVAIKQY
jgi:hypothetical protein